MQRVPLSLKGGGGREGEEEEGGREVGEEITF